jgi:serine/threonine protein kinase
VGAKDDRGTLRAGARRSPSVDGSLGATLAATPAPVSSSTADDDAAFGDDATVRASASDVALALDTIGPGTQIHQYELIRELGRGGMGVVWAARDTKLGRRVAMKFLQNATRGVAERFLTEARATAQCDHPNIVIIHEVNELGVTPYMVLEFLEGQALRELIPTGAGVKLPASRVVEIMLPVARALARAHDLGIVHRDLKPENVFVTTAGQVKVLDFGIAKALSRTDKMKAQKAQKAQIEQAPGGLHLTGEGAMIGTLPYMSPEQMTAEDVDHRADLWAVGIMMFEMLAGHHPIQPLKADALLENAVSETPMPLLGAAAPDVPEELAAIVDLLLRKRKDERIPQATTLVAQLEELLPGKRGRALGEDESPYPGLTAFQENDADRFFGRGRDVTRMVARVRELPFTGVVGPSGAGKSSFIRAGVGPALKASGERWDIVTMRPGRQPLAALAGVLEKLSTRPSNRDLTEYSQALVARLRAEPGYLGVRLRGRARQTTGHILLFVDQFEELYTLVPDVEERRAFTAALAAVADDPAAPLRVVVSMRSDFLDRVAEDLHLVETLTRGLVFLSPPEEAGLREALVAPLDLVGYRFESAAMVEDMLESLEGVQGALPLLQFAAGKLWEARDRQQRLITVSSYNAIGGISGALATHANDVVAAMDATAQRLTRKIFRALVTPERTRAIVELEELGALGDSADLTRVLDTLVAARLLVIQKRGDGGGGSVEIVHESLIARWPMLRRWLEDDQDDAAFHAQVSAAAKQWESRGQPAGLLWRGEAMEEAQRWYTSRPREIAPRDQAFLDAVFALARRGQRSRRIAVGAAFAVLGVIAAAAFVAFLWIRGAEQHARDNAAQANEALSQMKRKEQERLDAEQRKLDAEARQAAAVEDMKRAQTQAARTGVDLADSREALAKKNAELQKTLSEVGAARDKAEQASQIAQQKTREAVQAKTQLQQALAEKTARIKELEAERKKIVTKLKE